MSKLIGRMRDRRRMAEPRRPRRAAIVVSAVALAATGVVTTTAPAASAGVPASTVFFVDTSGTLTAFGRSSDGTWTAAHAVSAVGITAPSAQVAAVRLPEGTPAAVFVGGDGAVDIGCLGKAVAPLTKPNAAPVGAPIAVAVSGSVLYTAYVDRYGRYQTLMQEGVSPCDGLAGGPVTPRYPLPLPSYVAGSAVSLAALADRTTTFFYVDGNKSVHGITQKPSGTPVDSVLVPGGAAAAGTGIAVTPTSNVDSPARLSLFYVGSGNRITLLQPFSGGGTVATPSPQPWGAAHAATPWGAVSATSVGGTAHVDYVNANGAVEDLSSTASTWLSATVITAGGFAAAGSSAGYSSDGSGDGGDDYCGSTGQPFHIHWKHDGNPGVPFPIGHPNMIDELTQFAAA